MRRTLARTGSWTAALVFAACGGGGGGGGPSLEGSFFAVGYEADADPTATGRATWGADAESDGSTLTIRVLQNEEGTISGPTTEAFDVDVDGEGVLELRDTGSGEAILGGRVGENGDVVVAASVRGGDLPRVLTLVRDRQGAVLADLAGDHHFGLFRFDGGVGRGISGSATFDGLGAGSFLSGASVNIDGEVNVSGIADAAQYTMSSSGVVDLLVSASLPFQGGLDPTGEIAILGGVSASSEVPAWMILVHESVGASEATFAGTYGAVAIAFDFGGQFVLSSIGDVVADGAGNVEFSGSPASTINVDGTLASNVSSSPGTYSVAPDGTLTVGARRGGISQSGRYGFVAGGVTDGSVPQMLLLVRR